MSFQDLEAGLGLASARRDLINGKHDPTQAVASGIFQINTAVSSFHRLVNTLGTSGDTPELREKLHKTRLHIGELVKDTSARLKEASDTDHHSGISPTKKIADAKLAKDFQAVLKEFQKAQRLAAERETAYAPSVSEASLPTSYGATELKTSSDESWEQRALLIESRRQEVVELVNEIAFSEALIEEREQGIQEIQQQISEVNEIFKDLAVLVHDQGTMIDDIGSHIENSHAAAAQGKSQLVKAANIQRSNSSLVVNDVSSCKALLEHIILCRSLIRMLVMFSEIGFIGSHNHGFGKFSQLFSDPTHFTLSCADLFALSNLRGCTTHHGCGTWIMTRGGCVNALGPGEHCWWLKAAAVIESRSNLSENNLHGAS